MRSPFEGKIQRCFEKWRMHLLPLPRSHFTVLLTYLGPGDIPTWFDSWGSGSCFRWLHVSRLCSCSCQSTSYTQQNCSLFTLSKSCINGRTKWIYYETCHPSCRWVLLHPSAQFISRLKWLHLLPEFIGELEHRISHSFIVKHSGKVDNSSPLQDTKGKIRLEKKIEGEHHLKLINKWSVELPFLCAGSAKLSCGVVFSTKKAA